MSGQTSLSTDLILRLSGGEQEGELISINTEKCFLGLAGKSDEGGKPQCAIFRGPQGTTLRSYGNDTLVNGECKTVHWLTEGDQIKFPNSVTFEVQQLGYIPADSAEPDVCPNSENTEMQFEQDTQSTQTCEMNQLDAQEKIDQLESQIAEIKEQHEVVHGRFNELDDRMSQLAEQISTLVSIASSGNSLVPSQENTRMSCPTVVDLPIEVSVQPDPQANVAESFASEWEKPESSDSMDTMADFATPSEVAEATETITEDVVEEIIESLETPTETQAENTNESVADLLARMKEEGQWEGVPDEDSAEPTPIEPVEEFRTEEPVVANGGEEDDVDDYMSQLLSRMRGGEAPAAAPVATAAKKETQQENKKPAAPADLLKPEEFVPKQKAKKLESLSAMRELANSTARTAVQSSQKSVRQETAYVQLAIAVAALIMSGYYFGVESKALFDIGFLVGLFCIGVTGYLGYRFFNNMVLLKNNSLKSEKDKESTESPAEETSPA